jgi:hypothetical protein
MPILEKNSLLLEDLGNFLIELSNTFGETHRVRTATTKLRSLCQGFRPASVYTTDFRQLVCDVDWNDNFLINEFL